VELARLPLEPGRDRAVDRREVGCLVMVAGHDGWYSKARAASGYGTLLILNGLAPAAKPAIVRVHGTQEGQQAVRNECGAQVAGWNE
jgi:hypothetical protein